jgi:proliferating cell nuclear antigen PCNA
MSCSATLRNPLDFIRIVDILKEISDECTITFKQTGISISMMDVSLNCLCNIDLKKPYKKIKLPEEINISVNLKDFYNKLQLYKDDDCMEIIFKEDFINVIFYKEDNKKSLSKFKLRLINIQQFDTEYECENENEIKMTSSEFSNIINTIKRFDDKITFSNKDNEILCVSADEGDVELNKTTSDEGYEEIDMNSKFNLTFFLKYFISIKKAEKICDEVVVKFEEENPIYILYKKKNTELSFVISPLIDN